MSAWKDNAGVWAAMARLAVALGVGVNLDHLPEWTGAAGLVSCVWVDALAGVWLKRLVVARSRAREAAELLADFGCFGLLSATWVLRLAGDDYWVRAAVLVFVLASIWRLVRFHAEGLVSGCYRGLPTTYCGYAVPLIAAAIHYAGLAYGPTWCAGLLVLAWVMNSRIIRVPEF